MSEESKELFEKAKNMSLDEAYDYCLKLEYDREYSWRDSLQGGFESSMHSYDNLVDSFEDPSKIQVLSDNGKGKEYICASESAEAISVALSRLPRRDLSPKPYFKAKLGVKWVFQSVLFTGV